MIESIEWLRALVDNYPTFQYIIIFIMAVVGGEIMLFVFGFLAAQGVLPLVPLVFISFVGAYIPNVLWYLLGGTKSVEKITTHRHTTLTVSSIIGAVERMSRGNHVIALIIIKFLVGTPVLLTMYASKTRLSHKVFIYAQTIATLLSIIVIMTLGYIAGRGFFYVADIFENVYAAIGFILLVLVIIFGAQIWFEKLFTKGSEGSKD